ncbi:hypothetical protein [Leptospira yanagawae]|uniref:hypothetical protein n=1 Tax=Leptospira yanagawae TaxID=293069 RepID=UPI0012EC8A24|nr:hypothetical protein [Leptospira yanagawae]
MNSFGAQVETPKITFVVTTSDKEIMPTKNPINNSLRLFPNCSKPREDIDFLSIFLRNQIKEKKRMMVAVRERIFVKVNGFNSTFGFCVWR